MKNSLRIHKWTHNEFNIFILGVLTRPHVFIESMGAIIFYELVYFIFLFHTKPIPLQKYTINRDVEICIFRQWKQRKLLSSVF